ncbi:MAG: response regulator, partial [Acidimicrobiia bacterium]
MIGPVRVLVADDHPLYRRGLASTLACIDADVVAEAANGAEAATLAVEHEPDVVIMDLHMPELNGIEATRKIVQSLPNVAVLVVTMFDDDESVFAAMRAGARGYVLKDAGDEEILRAVSAVVAGEAIFSAPIAQRVIGYFSAAGAAARLPAFPELTEREREVLELIAQGHDNATIARRVYLSPKTVRNHVSNIISKLQVADRAQAIARARDVGIGAPPA